MTDYYVTNGLADDYKDTSNAFAVSSTCTVPADPSNGAYESSGSCAVGATLYSGDTCGYPSVTCDDSYEVSGTTRCVGGEITEMASCVAEGPTAQPTASVGDPTASPTARPSLRPTPKPTVGSTVEAVHPTTSPAPRPTSKPTVRPAPSPTAADLSPTSSVSSSSTYTTVGAITLAGLSYADAPAEEAVLITAVANAAGVRESTAALTIVAARRRRRLLDVDDSAEITYTTTTSTSTLASSALASMTALDATNFDVYLQAAASSASVTAIFADVSTSTVSEPTQTEDVYDVDAAVSKRPASLLAAVTLLATCLF